MFDSWLVTQKKMIKGEKVIRSNQILRLIALSIVLFFLTVQPSVCQEQDPAQMVGKMADELSASQQENKAPANNFYVGPGDVLEVSVWNDETLTREVIVRPDGFISFPLIGEVKAEGRTVDEIRQAVEEQMQDYVPDVPVTVMLLSLSSTRVYVIGKVQQPGGFLLNDETRFLQILSLAGGLTTFADRGGIVVIRDHGQEQELIEIDYDEIAKGKDLSQNIILEPGDTIVVP